MKGTDHILISSEINPGFTADTAVNLCKKTCRNLNEIDSSQICCRSKTGQVTNNAAAKCCKHIPAFKLILYQKFIKMGAAAPKEEL